MDIKYIKEIRLSEGVYLVKNEQRIYKCLLKLQTDFIFLFEIIESRGYKNICINKIEYILNKDCIKIWQ